MAIIYRYLWLFPLIVHGAYFAANYSFLPQRIGEPPETVISRTVFALEWIAIVSLSNVVLWGIWYRMPRFSNKVLSVPNREYWLKTDENRTALIERLQNLLESILVLVNVFFLGIFQWIYQSNVSSPVMHLPRIVLIGGFLTLPLLMILFFMLSFIKKLHHPNN